MHNNLSGQVILGLLSASVLIIGLAQAAEPADVWKPLRFLLGSWEGGGSGAPGEGHGYATFTLELDSNVMMRKNRTEFPPKPGEKSGLVHDDWLLIYPVAAIQGQSQKPDSSSASHPSPLFKAIYFDNEGHVINYNVAFPGENAATFETDPAQPGPRIRLEYTMPSPDVARSVFSFAMPGGDFKPYVSGDVRRVKE